MVRGAGGERIVDVVPGGTELELQVRTVSWAGSTHTHNNPRVQGRRLRVASRATAPGPALDGAPRFRPMSL